MNLAEEVASFYPPENEYKHPIQQVLSVAVPRFAKIHKGHPWNKKRGLHVSG
jgi:hypothetical protein